MTNPIGARKNASFKAVSTAPSFNKTPVGSATPPLPYPVTQDLGNSMDTVTSVRFNGDPAYVLSQTTQPCCKGDDPGTATGVKSGTVNGEVKPVKGSSSVRVGGHWIIRQGDPCTMNGGNCPGIYITTQVPSKSLTTSSTNPSTNPPVTPETPEEQSFWQKASPWVHGALGIASFVPGLSVITGGADAAIYAAEGDMINAGVAAVSMIPGGKVVTTAGKVVKAVAGVGKEVAVVGKVVHGVEGVAQIGKVVHGAEEVAQGTKLVDEETKLIKAKEAAAKAKKSSEGTKIKGKSKKEQVKENQKNGKRREKETEQELKEKYPDAEVQGERYLRDANGKIVKDPLTGEGRRLDHVVIKDGKVIDVVETTSLTVDKSAQIAKEGRIIESGGSFIRDKVTKELIPIGDNISRVIKRP